MGIQERKEREREHRREEILRAATEVFFEKGLQLSTMDEIAEKAELSKGTLYLYYKSKEDLYLAVMNVGIDLLHDMFSETLRRSSGTIESLVNLGDTYYAFFRQHRNYFRMFHFFQNPALHRQVSDEMMQTCREHNQKIWSLVVGVLVQGMEEGVLRKDLSPQEMAVVLWSSSNAIMLQIDHQSEQWRHTLDVNLEAVLRKANMLLIESVLTDAERTAFRSSQPYSSISRQPTHTP